MLRTVTLAVLLAACGGRTELGGVGADGGLDATGDVNRETGPSGPCEVDGVRVCGGGCPALNPPECPGTGCTANDRSSLTPLDDGVCWADLSGGEGVDPCDACNDGDVCAQRGEDLVCVPFDVCDKLYSLGAVTACRYADKSPFDDQPLANPQGPCPTSRAGVLCDGACGSCPDWTSNRCVGRSAGRAFGVCARAVAQQVWTCAVDPGGSWSRPCPLTYIYDGPNGKDNLVCQVFDVDASSVQAEDAYGLCEPQGACHAASQAIGGVHCYLPSGQDVH